MLSNFLNRMVLLEYINTTYPNGEGAEVGVASGCFSKQILETWKTCSKLYCIDLWDHQEVGYNDCCNLSKEDQNCRYEQIQKDFKGNNKVVLIKEWSHIAVNQFEDESLDFLYLDANHSYKACLEDLKMWYPKIKKGGILSGHDYWDGPDESAGVKKAVNEFVKDNNIQLFTTLDENSSPKALYPGWEGISYFFERT